MTARVDLSRFTGWNGQSSPHYTFGFYTACSSGGGPDRRAALFEAFSGLFDMPVGEAWAEANELVEGPDVVWAYRRATSSTRNTYGARLRETEPAELGSDRTFFMSRGSC